MTANQAAAPLVEIPGLEGMNEISAKLCKVAERRRAQEAVIAAANELIGDIDREAAVLKQRRADVCDQIIIALRAIVHAEDDATPAPASTTAPAPARVAKRSLRRRKARKASGRQGQFDEYILRAVAFGPRRRAEVASEIAAATKLDAKDGAQRVTARIATLIARGQLVSPGSKQGSATNVIALPEARATAIELRRALRRSA